MNDVTPAQGDRDRERTLPVNLLLKGRPCLVVGAGNVAFRKIQNLLAHGAGLVVVAPRIVPALRRLADAGRLAWLAEPYASGHLDEIHPFLVFAATDDDARNADVVHDAQRRGLLATSASCWREGDFISPSVIPWGEGQVSVTTEGASCRQARFMRERLEPVFAARRDYLVLGLRLGRSTRAACEHTQPEEARSREWVAMLRHLAALEEFVLLAEAGGVSILGWAPDDPGLDAAMRRLLGDPADADCTVLRGEDAARREAARAGSSFARAFERARESGHAGVHLEALLQAVPSVGGVTRA